MMKTLTQRWTYARAAAELPAELRFELIDDEICEMASPSVAHQLISARLQRVLEAAAEAASWGVILSAPLDVVLDAEHAVQPDLIGVRRGSTRARLARVVEGVPDLLVEIVSPSSLYRDYHLKKTLYERFGVAEYWIVDPAHRAVEVFALRDGAYDLHALAAEAGTVTSAVLTGFQLDVVSLFAVLDT